MSRFLIVLCLAALACGDTATAADLVVAKTPPELALTPVQQAGRRLVLQGMRLRAGAKTDPTFAEILEMVNAQLAAQKAEVRVAVHVTSESEAWWKTAGAMKFSESYEALARDETARGKYLREASAWELLTRLGMECGTGTPAFFPDLLVLAQSTNAPPEVARKLIAEYCHALGAEDWEKFRALHCINARLDRAETTKMWEEHHIKFTPVKYELLYYGEDLMVIRLRTSLLWHDYKPELHSYEVSLVTLRFDLAEREEKRRWRVWEVSQLDVGKEE